MCGVTIVGSDVAVLGSREQTMLDVCAAVFVFVWWTTMMSTCVCRVVVWSCGVCSGQGVVTAGIPSNACVNTHHNTAVERKPGQLQQSRWLALAMATWYVAAMRRGRLGAGGATRGVSVCQCG